MKKNSTKGERGNIRGGENESECVEMDGCEIDEPLASPVNHCALQSQEKVWKLTELRLECTRFLRRLLSLRLHPNMLPIREDQTGDHRHSSQHIKASCAGRISGLEIKGVRDRCLK